MSAAGRLFILFGIILIVFGVILVLGAKVPWLGRLPGDMYVQKKNFTFYFPVTTCILASIAITLIFFLIGRR